MRLLCIVALGLCLLALTPAAEACTPGFVGSNFTGYANYATTYNTSAYVAPVVTHTLFVPVAVLPSYSVTASTITQTSATSTATGATAAPADNSAILKALEGLSGRLDGMAQRLDQMERRIAVPAPPPPPAPMPRATSALAHPALGVAQAKCASCHQTGTEHLGGGFVLVHRGSLAPLSQAGKASLRGTIARDRMPPKKCQTCSKLAAHEGRSILGYYGL